MRDQEAKSTLDQRLVAICQTVRNEALEPALKEAESIKLQAERERERILLDAKNQAKEILKKAEEKAEETKRTLEMSLKQATKQALELLKEQIENGLFQPALESFITSELSSNEGTARLIEALIHTLEKEGILGDIECEIGSKLSKEAVAKALVKDAMGRLKNSELKVGSSSLGVTLKVNKKHIVIDISDRAVKELVSHFVRAEFRKLLFVGENE